ncbi:MAG: DnaJ domain-containing protein [Thermosynechococcaceae cyanobacterium MS004]|nr:DnaJ domain-containing protein [Thermosynechococcaceae cyanobacterium MS004]
MDIIECYRLLELTSTANPAEVKAAYRRLARQLHPDVNADDRAQEQFIRVTEAYKILVKIAASRPERAIPAPSAVRSHPTSAPSPAVKVSVQKPAPSPKAETVAPPSTQTPIQTPIQMPIQTPAPAASSPTPPSSAPPAPAPPSPAPSSSAPSPPDSGNLSFAEQKLKFETYQQLSDLIKRRSLPRAIATVEALQARLPNDLEIRQWQALIYQRWGRQLIEDRKLNQARAYLKKALKTDPHNKSLWTEIEQDFKRIENTY